VRRVPGLYAMVLSDVKVAFDRHPSHASTRDIGGDGICFEGKEHLPVSTSLTVWFTLPNRTPIEAAGRIVSFEHDETRAVYVNHVCFSRPDDEISSYILDARRRALTARDSQPISGPKYADIRVLG